METEDLRYLHRLHRLDRLGCRYFIFIFVQTKLFIEYLQVKGTVTVILSGP